MGAALGEGLYAWRPDRAGQPDAWVPIQWCDPGEGGIAAADSWRVRDGCVRGLEQHRERFLASAGRALTPEFSTALRDPGLRSPENSRHPHLGSARTPELVHTDLGQSADFWADVVAGLPRTGDWFPRVELRERGTLSFRLRPTPATATEVVVATAPHDPRTTPHVKGPDLDALLALRTEVQPLGAGEAIILDAQGRLIDGAYSALLWWRDGILTAPPVARTRIPSVTATLILGAAQRDGVPTAVADASPAELEGCELWVLSALHGVRRATAWVDGPTLSAENGRIEWARDVLDRLSLLLPPSV